MYDIYFTLRSVTRGQRGSEVLARAGIPRALIRAPREVAAGGCGYALTVRSRDSLRAWEALTRSGVPVEGTWRRLPGGGFERLTP